VADERDGECQQRRREGWFLEMTEQVGEPELTPERAGDRVDQRGR
jgi:hypothetical protein